MKEPLSYKEKQILVSLFNTMIILAAYSYYLHNRYSAFSAEMLSDLQFLGKSFLMLIPITIVIQIVFLIIFHIVLHIISSEKIPEITDERDKLIDLKSLRISHWVFITGFFLAMGSQALGMKPFVMFLALIISGFLAGIVSDIAKLIYYRKGV
jgi:hypothetical protein